jgi:hypothetical protein
MAIGEPCNCCRPGMFWSSQRETMSVRDEIAAACLPAIYANMTQLTDRAAELAYEQADEMLKARAPKPKCCGMRYENAIPCEDCPERGTDAAVMPQPKEKP